MRIAFLGNHTVGVVVLETLLKEADVVGVVAHPPDPEDGNRYRSVYQAGHGFLFNPGTIQERDRHRPADIKRDQRPPRFFG